jgi:two-component system, LytTR family, response regulator
MIRTLIVEDEPLARDLLRSYIALHPDIDLIGEATDGFGGTRDIDALSPDLVLMDISLPERCGIDVVRSVKRNPAIIFTTAYDAHALTAFELGAFDYLLKPFTPERFSRAIGRVRERLASRDDEPTVSERVKSVSGDNHLHRFFVRYLGKTIPVHVADIVRLEADDDYTAIHVAGKRLLAHVALRDMERRLDPMEFLRIHRSSIINLAHVRSSEQSDRCVVLTMSDGSQVTSSRSRTQLLHALRL